MKRPEVGDVVPPWTMERVSTARMRTVAAILRDPNPIHWDPSVLASKGLGDRVINQGPICVGYIANMLIAWAGPRSIRRLRIQFPGVVYGDDRVTARGTVTDLHEEEGSRLAECEVWLEHDDGKRALSGTAIVSIPDA